MHRIRSKEFNAFAGIKRGILLNNLKAWRRIFHSANEKLELPFDSATTRSCGSHSAKSFWLFNTFNKFNRDSAPQTALIKEWHMITWKKPIKKSNSPLSTSLQICG